MSSTSDNHLTKLLADGSPCEKYPVAEADLKYGNLGK